MTFACRQQFIACLGLIMPFYFCQKYYSLFGLKVEFHQNQSYLSWKRRTFEVHLKVLTFNTVSSAMKELVFVFKKPAQSMTG